MVDWDRDSEAHDPDELEAAASILARAQEPTCDFGGDTIGSYCGAIDLVQVSSRRRGIRRLCARHLPLVLWDWFAQGEAQVEIIPRGGRFLRDTDPTPNPTR
jgi:hypothetical protein